MNIGNDARQIDTFVTATLDGYTVRISLKSDDGETVLTERRVTHVAEAEILARKWSESLGILRKRIEFTNRTAED